MSASPVLVGIVGWKNSGKTTLVSRLVSELTARGLTVSTLKHAHHSFEVDQDGTDTDSHRKAGAREVAIVSEKRWAIMHELAEHEAEPSMADMLARLSPCDIVIAEGYKSEANIKIEIQRADAKNTTALYKSDDRIVAVVNPITPPPPQLATFDPDDISAIADFILEKLAPHLNTRSAS